MVENLRICNLQLGYGVAQLLGCGVAQLRVRCCQVAGCGVAQLEGAAWFSCQGAAWLSC
jgi:hypothetical protein